MSINLYRKRLNGYKDLCSIIEPEAKTIPSFHLLMFKITFKKLKLDKSKLIEFLLSKRIISQYHYIPFYKFIAFQKYKSKHKNKFNGCKIFFEEVLSLPIYYKLPNKYVIQITNFLKKFIDKNII